MYIGMYRFDGDPKILTQAYDKMIQMIPPANLHLHVCVTDEAGLMIYDTCPTREIFMEFSSSADFQGLLSQLGMPAPTVIPIGEIHGAYESGKQII